MSPVGGQTKKGRSGLICLLHLPSPPPHVSKGACLKANCQSTLLNDKWSVAPERKHLLEACRL